MSYNYFNSLSEKYIARFNTYNLPIFVSIE